MFLMKIDRSIIMNCKQTIVLWLVYICNLEWLCGYMLCTKGVVSLAVEL